MTLFVWDDSFSVGLDSVDYQHRRLVQIINLLDEAVSIGNDAATLRDIIKELYAYTEYHFTTEEELMRAAGPAMRSHYLKHKAEHDQFTATIRPLSTTAPLDATTLHESLFDYLIRWLVDHILGSDKEMGRLINEAGNWAAEAGELPLSPQGGILEDEHRQVVERNLLDALKESEVRFRSLSDNVPVLIWVSDKNGSRVFFNKPWQVFSGRTLAELKSGLWTDLVHPNDRAAYTKALDSCGLQREPCSLELRLRRSDGEYRWMLESIVPRLSANGAFLGTIGSALDISERKQAERALIDARARLELEVARQTAQLRSANEKLEHEKREQRALISKLQATQNQLLQSEKMASIGQLAAGVAHEINNPVGYIASNLGSLEHYAIDLLRLLDTYEEAEAALDEAHRSAVQRMKQQVDLEYLRRDLADLIRESREGTQRVKQIVQDLKDFSHVDEPEWQSADLHKGLDSTLNVVHNELKYKADVIKQYGKLPPVRCLPAQINQVFLNLLVNAAHAIPERGTITVRTGCEGEWVWIEIEDTGVGIPRENVSRIFDPFFTTKPVGKGTGLGLSLSYGIISKHEGRFEVDSEQGRGTRFRIWLPVKGPSHTER